MELLKSVFGRKYKSSQEQVARRAASVIDQVIYDVGVETLVNGTFVLDKKFRLRFIGVRTLPPRGALAAVRVSQLAESALFRELGTDGGRNLGVLRAHTACLTLAVVRELSSQSPAFRALPAQAA